MHCWHYVKSFYVRDLKPSFPPSNKSFVLCAGSSAMNLLSTLSKLLGPKAPPGGRALDTFEKSFQLRQSKGYLVNLDDPFKYLR